MDLGRRRFLGLVGIGAGAATAVVIAPEAATAMVALHKPKPNKVPLRNAGDLVTVECWNEIVERVNELSER